jgi:hypothetical protein
MEAKMDTITIKTNFGPRQVKAILHGPFALHRTVVEDDDASYDFIAHPEHWSVTLPHDGRTAGHFPTFWLASKAASHLISLPIDWEQEWDEIDKQIRSGGWTAGKISDTLKEVFGARYRYHRWELEVMTQKKY